MNQNPRRQPVQPWIPPQKPQKAAVRTVYVEREKAGGGGPAGTVMVLAVVQILAVGAWMLLIYNQGKAGGRASESLLIFGGGALVGGVLLAAVNVAQAILVVVALVRGAVLRGIAALVLGGLLAVVSWLGLIYGGFMALAAGEGQRRTTAEAVPVQVESTPESMPLPMQDIPDIESSSRRADLVRRAEAGAKIAHPETRTGLRRTLLEESTHGLTDPDAAQVRNEVNRLFDAAEAKWKARGLR
jgi:hypothetical protein